MMWQRHEHTVEISIFDQWNTSQNIFPLKGGCVTRQASNAGRHVKSCHVAGKTGG